MASGDGSGGGSGVGGGGSGSPAEEPGAGGKAGTFVTTPTTWQRGDRVSKSGAPTRALAATVLPAIDSCGAHGSACPGRVAGPSPNGARSAPCSASHAGRQRRTSRSLRREGQRPGHSPRAREVSMRSGRFTRVSAHRAQQLKERAAGMRWAPTASEARLFEAVRGMRLGVGFRRQVPLLGRYIADLLAPEVRLVIEVDGGYRGQRQGADERRDRALAAAGYRVLRLQAEPSVPLLLAPASPGLTSPWAGTTLPHAIPTEGSRDCNQREEDDAARVHALPLRCNRGCPESIPRPASIDAGDCVDTGFLHAGRNRHDRVHFFRSWSLPPTIYPV